MSKVKLLPHNQLTFEYILELSKNNKKICIPQATGTGKTWLEARILEEWSDKKAMIFAPRNEILDETCATLEDNEITNAETITYQTFNNMSDEDIINIQVDIILFDEAHRILATEWYKKVQILIESHPNSMIFGLTATPIRPDGRDIREEVFENCSTHYITLEEAIVRDIVKMPVYVSALYTFDEVVKELENKINGSKNSKEEKSELKKRLKAAKNNLELSMGVPTIIKKYITDYNGKYLVFCRNTEHLEESVPLVNKWFKEAGYEGNIFNYRIGSNFSDSDDQLEKFKEDYGEGLKLLFSIEKLNEGLHIPTVEGVILLRPTRSNIVYYQQIGRCIKADAERSPVILDLVNNANDIKIPLQEGVEKCIEVRKCGGYIECSQEFKVENYSIIDYLHETANVFRDIENQLVGLENQWTKEEDAVLYNDYPNGGVKECIKKLPKRNKNAIASRATYLGIHSNKRIWNEKNIEYLINNYENPNISMENIEINTGMNKMQIRSKAQRLGLKRNRGMSKEICDCIEREYPVYGAGYISKKYNVPISSVHQYAYRNKITYDNKSIYDEIDDIIKEFYPDIGSECINLINNSSFSKEQIRYRAKKLGIKFKKYA